MTPEILKQVGQVAGIGGLALGVFLLLFREIIRKTIFPQLTRERAYRLLRMILVLVWSVAVLGVLTWAYVATRPDPQYLPGRLDVSDVSVDRYRPHPDPSKLDSHTTSSAEITDISVNDYNPNYNAVLDFRVVNHGNRPLSINRIRFTVIKTQSVPTGGYLDYSAKYHLDISDLRKVGDTKDVIVSQSLQPGEVDRFAVILTARHMGTGEFRFWELKPTLFTSEGNVTPSATIKLGLPWNLATTMVLPGTMVHYSCEPIGNVEINKGDTTTYYENIWLHPHVPTTTFDETGSIEFSFKTGPSVRVDLLGGFLTATSHDVAKRALDIKDIRVEFRNQTATCKPVD